MSRYIDVEEFRERIDRYPPEIRDLAKKELRLCKTADVAPVKHGHWGYDKVLDLFQCSKCGLLTVTNDYPYCHWCGTKMDEVKE